MRVEKIDIDSEVLGRSVLAIHDFTPEIDWNTFENAFVASYDPAYVTVKVELERVPDIHALESHGFRFVECQIRSQIRLRKLFDVSSYPYEFVRVRTAEDLDEVLAIAGTTFDCDRFWLDPAIGRSVSGARYRAYVRRSFAQPDEAVYRLLERGTGRTVAFKTHAFSGGNSVRFLLGGVHPEYKGLGLGIVNEYFEFNQLIQQGVRSGITHISASNHAVFNLEIGSLGFRVLKTFAVMRKLYGL